MEFRNQDFEWKNQEINLAKDSIDSREIARHAIEEEDIDTGSITSRTIRNYTIQGEDINPNTDITVADILSEQITAKTLTLTDQATIPILNVTNLIDFGTNTIYDGNFTGDWNWNGGDLTNIGIINAGATNLSGNLDMQNNLILNIGNAGTNFTATGGLNLAGNLDVNGLTNDIAGTLNLSGNTLTAGGLLTITPTLGLTINTPGQTVTLETQNFDVNATGNVTIDGVNFTYTPTGTYAVTPGGTYTVDATGTVSIDSDASATLSGAGVNLTSDGANAITLTYAAAGGTFELTDGTTRLEIADNGNLVLGDDGATTIIDGSLITLSGNTLITGTITETLTDNSVDALDIQEGVNNYININTTNAAEAMQFGNVATHPSYSFLGTGLTTLNGGLNVVGNGTLGTNSANTLAINAVINSDVIPEGNTRDFGSNSNRWEYGYFTNIDATNIFGVIVTGSTASNSWTINSDNVTNNAEIASLIFKTGTLSPIDAVLQWNATNDPSKVVGFDNSNLFNFPIAIYSKVNGANQTFTSGSLFKFSQPASDAITQSGAFIGANIDFSSNLTVLNDASGNQTGFLATLKDGGAGATAIGFQTAGTMDYGLDLGGTIGTADIRLSNAATIVNNVNGVLALTEPTIQLIGFTAIDIDSPLVTISGSTGLTLGDSAAVSFIITSALSGATDPTLTFGDNMLTVSHDLTISGDDLFMATNTANYFLMADGVNYNPTTPANAIIGLGLTAGGLGDIWVEKAGDTMTGTLTFSGIVTDITSVNNEHIAIMPNGTGNVGIGTTSPVSKLHIGVAPTASANYGTLSIGGGAFDGATAGFFAGSASGTSLAVNEVTGYAGNLIDAQVNGVTKFKVSNLGAITSLSTINASGIVYGLSFQPTSSSGTDWIAKLRDSTRSLLFQDSSGTSLMTILGSGNVGIGTTSPNYPLDVRTTTSGEAIAGINTRITGNNYGIDGESLGSGATLNVGGYFGAGGATTNYGLQIGAPTAGANNWALYSSSAAQSYFAGNVGIGTTGPGAKLELSVADASDILKLTRTGAGAASAIFNLGGARLTGITTQGALVLQDSATDATDKAQRFGLGHYTNTEEPFYTLFNQSTSLNNVLGIGGGTVSGNAATIISFFTAANNTTVTGTERMRIGANGGVSLGSYAATDPGIGNLIIPGNVGIGTTDPGSSLDVVSTTATASRIAATSAGTSITSSANVIKIVNTDQTNNNWANLFFTDTLGGTAATIIGTQIIDHTNNYGNLAFWTRGSDSNGVRMQIDSNGNVGIGTTNPTAYLQIKAGTATVGTAPLKLTTGTLLGTTEAGAIEFASSHLYFTAADSGTRYQLDQTIAGADTQIIFNNAGVYAGSAYLTFSSTTGGITKAGKGTGNIFMGTGTGNSTMTGTYNILLGDSAGVALDTGSKNNAIGYRPLYNATSAEYNNAIGFNAMGAGIVTGNNNNAIGESALLNATSAANNNAIGSYAMGTSVVTGSNNNAIGNRALQNLTTGNQNNAIGYYAMGDGTITGSNNNAIGYRPLYNATSATYNNAIGYYAMGLGVVTGSNNNAIGQSALFYATSATYNNALGYYAMGAGVVTGSDNNAFGQFALNNATTANNNNAIGSNAMGAGVVTGYDNNAIGSYTLRNATTATYNNAIGVNAMGTGVVTGSNNNAFGQSALLKATSAGYNNAFGTQTLLNATTATFNNAIGYLAMGTGIVTGSDNNAFGRSALANATSASGNIAIGYAVGDNLTTGTNNILLGYNIDASAVDMANSLNIGNLIFATGMDGTGTTLSTGNVGIGTTTPTSKLQIQYNNIATQANNGTENGLSLVNSTAATAGVISQDSSALEFQGQYWDGAASQAMVLRGFLRDNGSGTNATMEWSIKRGAGAITNILVVDANGQFGTALKFNSYNSKEVLTLGRQLGNDAAATVSYDQYTPYDLWKGFGWKTAATAGSQQMAMGQVMAPEQGVTNPVGVFKAFYGTNTSVPVEANELYRLEWGDRLGFTINNPDTAGFNTLIKSNVRIDDNAATGIGLVVTGGGSGGNLASFTRDVGADGQIAFNAANGDPKMILDVQTSGTGWYTGVDDSDGDKFMIGTGGDVGTAAALTIDTTGKVGIGTVSPSVKLNVVSTADEDVVTIADSDGTCTLNPESGGAWSCTSDERLKKDIASLDMSGSLSKIMGLRPVSFTMIKGGDTNYGFIAQEVRNIIPEAVSTFSNGYLGVAEGKFTPYIIGAIQEQQNQISSLSSTQALNAQNIQNILAQQALLDGRISGLSDSLQSGLDATNAKILSLENQADDTKNKTSLLGMNLNFVRGQVSSLYGKVLGAETSTVKEEVLLTDFASENIYQHSNLDNVDYSGDSFGGTYSAISEFKEIGVDLPTGIDLSQYDTDNAVLQFEVYMQDASLFQDFATELGNSMDEKELQWEESAHPWFTDGWNTVRLPLESGTKTGEIDWSDLKHFRAYFKFSGRSEVRIKNVAIEARKKAEPIAEGASFALDGQVLKLDSLENQNKLLLALDEKAGQSDLVIKSQDNRIQDVETKLADQTAIVSAQTELLTTLKVDGILYKDELGNLNLGEGGLIVNNIEAKQVKTDTLEMTDNKASGKSFIPAGLSEIVIETTEAYNESKIYITATGSSYGKILYVSEEDTVPGVSFKVKFDGDPIVNNDIKFNWLIIK